MRAIEEVYPEISGVFQTANGFQYPSRKRMDSPEDQG